MKLAAILLPSVLLGLMTSAGADDCVSNAPRCANANAKAMKLLNDFPSMTGMSASARSAYCAAKIGAEVNSFCASEFRSQGRSQCAADLEKQATEFRAMAEQNRIVMGETAAYETDKVCLWQQ